MSLKPGMSYKEMQALEKGALKDAVAGISIAASMAAASAAQNHSKEMMNPLSHVQMEDTSGHTQEVEDPTKVMRSQTQEKVASFKKRLAEIRTKLKAGHQPASKE